MVHSQPVGVQTEKVFRPLHVLTLTPFYPGAKDDARGCFVSEPLGPLQQLGVDNTVIAVQPFYRGKVEAIGGAYNVRWQRYLSFPGGAGLPTSGAFLFLALISKVRAIHSAKPVDLIHAHAALPCGHVAALLSRELGIPFVVTVHGLDAYFTNQVSGYFGLGCERISRWVYKSAQRVICISEKVREKVLEKVRADATVIYNGVDPQLFSPSTEADASNSILSVGNLIPIKGQELLLRAFAAVQDQFPGVECDLVGDGPERQRLEKLSEELSISGKVHFLGRKSRKDLAGAMKRCLLFALPSRYEGLGCVYLEAMACEKPVIACAQQGIEEIIQHGRNGWLMEPGSLPDMTDALLQLLGDAHARRQIGEEARRTILAGYTLAHQAEMLLRLYRGCIA
jgi:teichuronic acid biosynthesis glycosyltransferase TuaC